MTSWWLALTINIYDYGLSSFALQHGSQPFLLQTMNSILTKKKNLIHLKFQTFKKSKYFTL